jgi:hypothetical protein
MDEKRDKHQTLNQGTLTPRTPTGKVSKVEVKEKEEKGEKKLLSHS